MVNSSLGLASLGVAAQDYRTDGYQASESQPSAMLAVNGHLLVASGGGVTSYFVTPHGGGFEPRATAAYPKAGPVSIAPAGGHLVVRSGDRLAVFRVLAGNGQVATLSTAAVTGAQGTSAWVRPAGGMLITAAATEAVASYHIAPTGGQITSGQTIQLPGQGMIDLGYSTGSLILARGGMPTSALVSGQQIVFRQTAPCPGSSRLMLAQCNGNLIVGNRAELRSHLVDAAGLITPRAQTPLSGAPAGQPLQSDAIRTPLVVPPGFVPSWDADSLTLSMKGEVNGLGLLLSATKTSYNEQELGQFAEPIMGAIGQATGVSGLTAKAHDTLEIGGRPALLRHNEGEKQGLKVSFLFLFFSSAEYVYTTAYIVPTERYDDYLPSFTSFLNSLKMHD